MGIMTKVNKFMDFLTKFGIVALAFSVALIPVIFLLGHETLHQQPWNDSMAQHSDRAADVQVAKALEVSNIFLKKKGSVSKADVRDTMELADFVCYTLQSQGEAVVRRNIETKGAAAKKGKKKAEVVTIEGYKTSKTLHETPPLKDLKNKLAKLVDFETESLSNKYWVIVVSGQLDSHVVSQVEKINSKHEGYKFVIVSPTPIQHKVISETLPSEAETPEESAVAVESQPDEGETAAEEPTAEIQAPQEEAEAFVVEETAPQAEKSDKKKKKEKKKPKKDSPEEL